MNDVDKDHQGHGLATKMMNHLKAGFKGRKINWGMTTPEGKAFKRAYYSKTRTLPAIDKLGYSFG
jgi:hypothetical protein